MNSTAVFRVGAGMIAGTMRHSADETDLRALKFRPAHFGLGTVTAHPEAGGTDGDTVRVDGKVVLENGRTTAFAVEVNKGPDAVVATVFIESHGVMSGVQKELINMCFREELFHREPVIKEAVGIMP